MFILIFETNFDLRGIMRFNFSIKGYMAIDESNV
jgi:hypothetical protein